MKLYIIDAFTNVMFGGNPAGVVICDDKQPGPMFMQALASELGFSETAFITPRSERGRFDMRYFTPICEVDLCGHATIASFCALGKEGRIRPGDSCVAYTNAGAMNIDIDEECVWMDMAPPVSLGALDSEDLALLYDAYDLDLRAMPDQLTPEIISTGLPDIIMPVNEDALFGMEPDLDAIAALSKKYGVVGVHAFCLCGDCTARCRNFAPLYGIDEEAATGTSNGALSYYLYERELIKLNHANRFVQGECMGRPSVIQSKLVSAGKDYIIRIGGSGVIISKGEV